MYVPVAGSQERPLPQVETTQLGASLYVGGYFGGEAREAGAVRENRAVERFGNPSTFVLTTDFGASVGRSNDSSYGFEDTSFTLQPAFDYFVARGTFPSASCR